jgi:hypothetical protein
MKGNERIHIKFWPWKNRPLFSLSVGLQFCGWFLSYATMLYQLHLLNGHDRDPSLEQQRNDYKNSQSIGLGHSETSRVSEIGRTTQLGNMGWIFSSAIKRLHNVRSYKSLCIKSEFKFLGPNYFTWQFQTSS